MLTNINNAGQYGLMARKTCQMNPLSVFDKLVDGNNCVEFHFSKVFGLVSQGILIKTYSCVRRNKQLSHLQI